MIQDSKVDIITAKELRLMGIEIPASVPDHAYVQKSSVKSEPTVLSQTSEGVHSGIGMQYKVVITEEFKV
jgi:hypothetical protein